MPLTPAIGRHKGCAVCLNVIWLFANHSEPPSADPHIRWWGRRGLAAPSDSIGGEACEEAYAGGARRVREPFTAGRLVRLALAIRSANRKRPSPPASLVGFCPAKGRASAGWRLVRWKTSNEFGRLGASSGEMGDFRYIKSNESAPVEVIRSI